MYNTRRRGRLQFQEYLSWMGKYSLADILGHGGVNQSPHITKKSTRTGGTIVIKPLTAVIIVEFGGGGGRSDLGQVRGDFQVSEAEAKAVDAEILITRQAS